MDRTSETDGAPRPKIYMNLSLVITLLYEANHIITEMNIAARAMP